MATKDLKGRNLRPGETQLKTGKFKGRYAYQWIDSRGKRHTINSWRLTATDKVPEGKRNCKPLRDMINDILKEEQEGIDRSLRNMTLHDYHILAMNNKNLRDTTKDARGRAWKRVTIASKKVVDLRRNEIAVFLQGLQDEGLSKGYILSIYNMIVAALEEALQDGCINKNVAIGLCANMNFEPAEQKKSLTTEETKLFFDYVRNTPRYEKHYPLFAVMAWTGARVGELCALTWDNIDFENNTIRICKTLTYTNINGHQEKHLTPTKTSTSNRIIPMMEEVRRALLMQKQSKLFQICREEIDGVSNFVFTTQKQCAFTEYTVYGQLKRIVNAYNAEHEEKLPNISPHIFRHTFATRLCEATNNIKFIQDIMGHSDVNTTLTIYAECQGDKKQEEMKKIDSLLKMG